MYRLRQRGIRHTELANPIGLSEASIIHRFRGRTPWSIDEMYQILGICRAQPEELHIYFPDPATQRGRRSA